ncbi:PP2C family protein-serine/threonine phosphatase [Paracoccus sp. (in: a-proteobacteria)]|uniref:PP2C family protein-serine/threonine phosphatase n=1 Tax=Paracoccus sp. TaxID=267 RepID=UPI0026DF9E12|nr:SpoIIE family protein phosphatase [Paracoccus sp. (in: a-proteobacteria)]MDO5369490.1 SpoIIE family protein phosphatase [Paracoccus sp. (in: a-proteobacteria)]
MKQPNRLLASVPAVASGHDPRRRLVLLADTNRANRRMLSIQLQRAGYRVVEAAEGESALQACRNLEPDLILSDSHLGALSGLELCRAHRTMARQGYGYFILLTSSSQREDIAVALGAGADDFLMKPISSAELLARIRAAERVLDMHDNLAAANRELQGALERLHRAQEQMTADLREARKLQQAMIRERQRSFGPFRVSLLMRPAGMIGGDFVGFQQLDDMAIGLHAVDVAGHGVASALLTARVAAQIEALSQDHQVEPARLVSTLNDLMLDGPIAEAYLTMVYARLDLSTHRLRLVQAGHPHPFLQRAGGAIERVGQGGLPVGVLEDARFDEIEVVLNPGDRMLIVSDGITDAASSRGEPLGEDGLRAILQLNAPVSGHALLESMCWSVSAFASGERSDDLSAVLIEHLVPASVLAGPGA